MPVAPEERRDEEGEERWVEVEGELANCGGGWKSLWGWSKKVEAETRSKMSTRKESGLPGWEELVKEKLERSIIVSPFMCVCVRVV